jgi:PAS domain S-box-containing protein
MPPPKDNKRYQSIFESASDGLIVTDLETQLVAEANPAACAMHGYTYREFIGLHQPEIVHPNSHSLYRDYLQAVQAHGNHEAQLIHIRRDGTQFNVEVRGTSFTYQDRPCLLSVVRDISRRVLAERLLQNRVEARAREQSTLLDISQTLASGTPTRPDPRSTPGDPRIHPRRAFCAGRLGPGRFSPAWTALAATGDDLQHPVG